MRILQAQGRGRRRAAQSGRPEARHGAFTWADATERGLSRATPPRPRWEPRKRTCPLHHPRQVGSQTRFLMKRRGEHPQRLACGKPCRIFHTHVILPGRRGSLGPSFTLFLLQEVRSETVPKGLWNPSPAGKIPAGEATALMLELELLATTGREGPRVPRGGQPSPELLRAEWPEGMACHADHRISGSSW